MAFIMLERSVSVVEGSMRKIGVKETKPNAVNVMPEGCCLFN